MASQNVSSPSNGAFHDDAPISTANLIPVSPLDSLALQRTPDLVLGEAQRAAEALQRVIEGKPRKVQFNGKTYLQFEDWQTLGRFYGVTAAVQSTKEVKYGDEECPAYGFEATAHALLVNPNGTTQIISSAEAMCLDDESNWSAKPKFQLKSMAQTRACAKALRNVLAWVVVLAGYAPTPAEEMDGVTVNEQDSGVGMPRRKSAKSTAQNAEPDTITVKQQKRLFAIAADLGVDKEAIREIINRFGFEFSKEITKSKYEAICAQIKAAA